MTFLPLVLTKDDPNNSTPQNINPGLATLTTGYNSIIITISGITGSCAVELQYSNDTNTSNFNTFYMESNITGSTFIKSYPILKNYYRIKFTLLTAGISVISRLSTQSYQSNTTNTVNTFENSMENIYDAFGKLRVSFPNTLLDLRVPGQDASGIGTTGSTGYLQNDIQICYRVSGAGGIGATGYKICQNSQSNIFVTGDYTFINQSRKYCTYQPGKSLLIMASCIMDARSILNYGTTGVTGVTGNTPGMKSRVGYFDQYNGLYFEYDSQNGCSICVKSKGALEYQSPIGQTGWNIDQMKGNGPSGLTLDWTKAQLFVIDLEWLGVGRVRFGFYAYGRIQYCHEILNINQISVSPYTYNINLPLRYELQGTTGTTGAMIQICSTVISEGGYNPIGRPFSISNVAGVTASSDEYPLIAIRGGGNNYYHQQILPTQISITSAGTNDILIYYLRLYLPPNSPTISWTDVNSNYSVTQYALTPNINNFPGATGSYVILDENIILGKGGITYSSLSNVFTELIQITSDVNNISAVLVLSVKRIAGSGSGNIYASMSWQEIY